MSEPKKMTLRVQSSEGTARVEVSEGEVTARLYERVHDALQLASFAFALYRDRGRKDELASSKSRTVRELGLAHGDMLYLSPVNGAVLFDQPSTSSEANNKPFGEPVQSGTLPSTSASRAGAGAGPGAAGGPPEDEVDLLLYQMPGSIERQRDDKLCRHNSKGCCVHCSPLEPWDESYLREHNIKHLSFHSYLRKITSGKFVSLEELSCKIKPGCKEHPPWPRGICSACQPSAVTLNRQPYRHVDNVLVERPAVVDRFLAYWRATGHQRLGYLYGRYEHHPDVPLGIRARVSAIYEPAQTGGRDSIQLQADARQPLVDDIAARLGLRRVGWIFTDLLPHDVAKGTVKRTRGADTHFLSAQECITAATFQNQHPNACRAAPAGTFGSKHVTVVCSGDARGGVALDGYQVSGQAAALVRDQVLLPTRDAPELGYIRDSSDDQYVPDVYYKETDGYGNEVGVAARRVPVAYLLVDVPVGVARDAPPDPTSPAPAAAAPAFPPANRALPDHLQTLAALHHHIQRHSSFLEAVSDLHVLVYLASNEALPLPLEALAPLLAAVRAQDAAAAAAWRATPPAATLAHLLAAAADHHPLQHPHPHPHPHPAHTAEGAEGGAGAGAGAGAEGGVWTCALCTFHNAARASACEMCAMPRNNAM